MRKNVKTVMEYWLQGKPCNRFHSISTDGKKVYSYNTVMLEHNPILDLYVFNDRKYSCTTSCQQSGIMQFLNIHSIGYIAHSIVRDKQIA